MLAPKTPEAKFVAQVWDSQIAPSIVNGSREAFREAAIGELNLWGDTDPASAARAIRNGAFTGLMFGRTNKLLYLTPFKDRKDNNIKKLQVIIGYRGYIELAFAGGFMRDLHTDVVYDGEPFEFWKDETGPKLMHRVCLNRTNKFEGIVGSYCLYHTIAGGRGIHVVAGVELNKLKDSSDIWRAHPVPMCRKTAVRRSANEWVQIPQLRAALLLDDLAEAEELQPDLGDNKITPPTVPVNLADLPAAN